MGLVPVILRKNRIDEVTYNDACFYKPDMDINYYFLKRLGMSDKRVVNANKDKTVTINEGNLNSSRGLKATEVNGDTKFNKVMILTENVFDKVDEHNEINNIITVKGKETEDNVEQKADIGYKYITYHDYLQINVSDYLDYDTRSIGKYLGDELIHHHSLIKLLMKDSILDSKVIAYLKFVFKINFIFALNAMAFSDNLIEQRASDPFRVTL
jgi:hypothetical protein